MEKDGRKSIVVILFVIIVLLIGAATYLVYTKFSDLGSYNCASYSIKYVRNWTVDKKSDTSINFNHQSESTMKLDIRTLEEKNIKSTDEIINSFLDYIDRNTGYKLISKENTTNTKNNYDGASFLYEYNDENILYIIGTKYNKVFLFCYKSKILSFDILLDSVLNTIYNLNIKGDL